MINVYIIVYIYIYICILAETELFLQGCFGHAKGYYLTALLGMFELRPGCMLTSCGMSGRIMLSYKMN